MTLTKKRLSISFYLLSPNAKTQSVVYVSISKNYSRLRFTTGENFFTSYCNLRRDQNKTKKGQPFKDLLKRNTVFFLEYKLKLEKITNTLTQIDQDFSKQPDNYTLTQIRDTYYLKAGLIALPPAITFESAFDSFINENTPQWSTATITKVNSTLTHFLEFEKAHGEIDLQKIDIDLWNKIKNQYFVDECKFSNNTSNKYLSFLRQFIRYAKRKGYIKSEVDFDQMKYLEEIEPYKIALKLHEVEKLATLDLSGENRLEKVRDLFLLEIMTGQRFSDIPALLNKDNISDTAITIYQQKTNEKVNIPLHPKLKTHLKGIFSKYPEGLPVISNQKFNDYLQEICKDKAKFITKHSWVTMTGKDKKKQSAYRYDLISSHSGRRTFCTLALAAGINAETIMKVTGHKKYDQFRDYVKVDDSDVNEAFENKFMNDKK